MNAPKKQKPLCRCKKELKTMWNELKALPSNQYYWVDIMGPKGPIMSRPIIALLKDGRIDNVGFGEKGFESNELFYALMIAYEDDPEWDFFDASLDINESTYVPIEQIYYEIKVVPVLNIPRSEFNNQGLGCKRTWKIN